MWWRSLCWRHAGRAHSPLSLCALVLAALLFANQCRSVAVEMFGALADVHIARCTELAARLDGKPFAVSKRGGGGTRTLPLSRRRTSSRAAHSIVSRILPAHPSTAGAFMYCWRTLQDPLSKNTGVYAFAELAKRLAALAEQYEKGEL